MLSETTEWDEEGNFLPILLPSRFGPQGRLVLLLNWYLHFLDQSYAPACQLYHAPTWLVKEMLAWTVVTIYIIAFQQFPVSSLLTSWFGPTEERRA